MHFIIIATTIFVVLIIIIQWATLPQKMVVNATIIIYFLLEFTQNNVISIITGMDREAGIGKKRKGQENKVK